MPKSDFEAYAAFALFSLALILVGFAGVAANQPYADPQMRKVSITHATERCGGISPELKSFEEHDGDRKQVVQMYVCTDGRQLPAYE